MHTGKPSLTLNSDVTRIQDTLERILAWVLAVLLIYTENHLWESSGTFKHTTVSTAYNFQESDVILFLLAKQVLQL